LSQIILRRHADVVSPVVQSGFAGGLIGYSLLHHDLQSLRLFVALCECRSLSKAAEKMNLAISAASRRLRLLEEEVGASLMDRLPHGVQPTHAGITTLRYAQSVLLLSDQLIANMEEHRSGIRGRVRVSASSSALVQRLAQDLARFMQDNLQIKVDLEERTSSETIAALAQGQADLGVIVRGSAIPGLVAFPYAHDRLALAVFEGHPLFERKSVRFQDVIAEEFVALDAATAVHQLLVQKAREHGCALRLRVQVRSFEAMCQMVRQRLGIGILPDSALRPLAEALGLRLIKLDETWARRDIDVCVPVSEDLDPPTARLLAILRGGSQTLTVSP
jgi:DNA-binding transcriptional LysR family regulator